MLLEKPIALELFEADELIEIARRGNLKFTIGYSQRFNTRLGDPGPLQQVPHAGLEDTSPHVSSPLP